ncbi:MAG TPA: SCO family protein [bacterium]|nr:SCO family protein [bacterium]
MIPDGIGARLFARPWVRGVLAVLVLVLVVAGAAVMQLLDSAPPQFVGAAPMVPPMPAYNFRLLDQAGHHVTLASFRGKAVALTFLYTHCPDVCPVIAEKMREASTMLGASTARVAFVAVSVDPRGDTPEAVRAFLVAHRVTYNLVYLTGPLETLRPVWAHYYIGTGANQVNSAASDESTPSIDLVTHNSMVYVIDPRGSIRLFLPASFSPGDLATDLRLLTSMPRERSTGSYSDPRKELVVGDTARP